MNTKNIVCWDVETTGLSPREDYIIQLAAIKLDQNLKEIDSFKYLVKPPHKYRIDPAALETHHITEEMIEKCGVPLVEVATQFVEFCEGCDFLTYNGNRFDIKFLYKDFELVGVHLDLENRIFYDSMQIETVLHPRTLSAIYKQYTGQEPQDAHDALGDVKMTTEVFRHQITYIDRDEMATWKENQMISPDGTIRDAAKSGEEPYIVFNVGKYKDTEFMKVCEIDIGYVEWFFKNIASTYTIKKLRQYYKDNRTKHLKK